MVDHETKTRLLIRIAWELRKEQSFDTIADFADVFKRRLVSLRIHYEPLELSECLARIASHASVVADPLKGLERVKGPEILPEYHDIPRFEAARIYSDLTRRFGPLVKRMPTARPSNVRLDDQEPRDETWGDHDRY